MRHLKVPSFFGPLFLSMFLVASLTISTISNLALYAQTQAAASSSTTPAAAPNEKYVYCFTGSTGPVVYFSDIFAAVPTSATFGPHAGRNGYPEFAGPFLAFLQKKYGYKSDSSSPPVCRAAYNPNPEGLRAAQTTKQAAQDLAKQANQKVVETGWKYTP
jgi:hypothetical protein